MIIKPNFAAVAAVTLVVPFLGQPAHAGMNNFTSNPPDFSSGSQTFIPDQIGQPASAFVPPQPPPAPVAPPQAQAPIQIAEQMQPPRVVVASSSGNNYVNGQCTWYVKNKRPDLPNGLGNGGQWVANAAARGFSTGTSPRAGAVGEQPGHVVYIESVSGSNVNISEMNYNGGVGVVHTRTVAASTFKYIY